MKFVLVFGLLLLGACSHVRVVTPNPRVEVPEVRGEGKKWKFGVAGGNAHQFYATDDASKRPPDMNRPEALGALDVYPNAHFAPIAPLELGVELDLFGMGINGLAKWQILGDGTRNAKEGNFPLAVFVRTGVVQNSNDGDQNGEFGPGGYPWKGKITNRFVHAGVSLGHRVSDRVLLFAGVAGGKYWAEAEIRQDATSSDAGGSYNRTYPGDGKTAGAGVMWSWRVVQFYVAGEYTRVDYGPTDDMEALFLNTGISFTPGRASEAAPVP